MHDSNDFFLNDHFFIPTSNTYCIIHTSLNPKENFLNTNCASKLSLSSESSVEEEDETSNFPGSSTSHSSNSSSSFKSNILNLNPSKSNYFSAIRRIPSLSLSLFSLSINSGIKSKDFSIKDPPCILLQEEISR